MFKVSRKYEVEGGWIRLIKNQNLNDHNDQQTDDLIIHLINTLFGL